MLNKFNSGDVVRLKSGGPKMTVEGNSGTGDAICSWYDESKGEYLKQAFAEDALERYEPKHDKRAIAVRGSRS
ncbi:YodC family protein [Proteus terrae]|uniref:YodC family protein n=1 Tax=Proteus terrae TaxID=1574161 RepID=UPI00288B2020|nr:DUF2158 domain-containing protein [Proteus terrae]